MADLRVIRDLPEMPERIDIIADMMRKMHWKRGESAKALAKKWGCAQNTVETAAAEASRRTALEVSSPKVAQASAATHCLAAMARALEANNFKAVASCADVMTRILGARAPDKIEIGSSMREYESLTVDQKIAWLDARISAAMQAKAQLLAEKALPAVVVESTTK